MLPEDEGGIVQKGDTTKALASKVNYVPQSPEDLVDLVDISVSSKYNTDLVQLTRPMGEDVHSMLDSF
jgi:hypothetical protein